MNALYDIANDYVRHLDMELANGSGAEPLLPIFILDVVNSIFCSDIRSLDNKRTLKKEVKEWARSYRELNSDFFRILSRDKQDRVIDEMDAFESFIGNEVMITRVAVMNLLSKYGVGLDDQRVLSSSMICNTLAQCAQIVWGGLYGGGENTHIKGIILHSSRWMKIYFKNFSADTVDLNEDKAISNAVQSLCNKIVRYIKNLS